MGAAAPAVAAQPAPGPDLKPQGIGIEEVRTAAMSALAKANQSMLYSMLEAGEWKLEGSQLTILVAASAALIEMSVSAEARRLIIASASGVLAKPIKLQIAPGATPAAVQPKSSFANGSSRARAEQDPVVQRMREKFGAEIRTVIDYRKN
jgi:DNA polymerase III subunit gamma/tau